MAKKENRWTEKDLIQRGLVLNSDGTYSRKIEGETYTRKSSSQLFCKDEVFGKATVISPQISVNPIEASVLTIDGLVAGLNSANGLMRLHWAKRKKQKELYEIIVSQNLRENKIRKHSGEVTVEYIGYKSRLMDWDNFCSSFKLIGDALVKVGIITDDNPSIITQFIPSQIKVKQIDQKVVVIIRDK